MTRHILYMLCFINCWVPMLYAAEPLVPHHAEWQSITKAIREGKASITEAFCEFNNNELFVINMTIQEYSHAVHFNHVPKSERKLLLNRNELRKLEKQRKCTSRALRKVTCKS